MKTSKEWWNEVKNSEVKLVDWLQKQYTGEVTASDRIKMLGNQFGANEQQMKILNKIAEQERTHAEWIYELLISRGINPAIGDATTRYWAKTIPGITDFETGTAVAAHAEKMRLERITAISQDEDAPEDIRNVFKNILKDEIWHEKSFRALSTESALAATVLNHELGCEALGLTI